MNTSSLVIAVVACDNDPAKGNTQVSASAPVASDSRIEFVGAKVTRKHDGSFQTFTGAVNLVDSDPTKGSVTTEIDIASIKADEDKLTNQLKSPDLLDAAKFPKATFTSTSTPSSRSIAKTSASSTRACRTI